MEPASVEVLWWKFCDRRLVTKNLEPLDIVPTSREIGLSLIPAAVQERFIMPNSFIYAAAIWGILLFAGLQEGMKLEACKLLFDQKRNMQSCEVYNGGGCLPCMAEKLPSPISCILVVYGSDFRISVHVSLRCHHVSNEDNTCSSYYKYLPGYLYKRERSLVSIRWPSMVVKS